MNTILTIREYGAFFSDSTLSVPSPVVGPEGVVSTNNSSTTLNL